MLKKHGRLYALLVVLMLVFLFQYIRMMDITARIQEAESEIVSVQHENKKLTIALAKYTSLENIDALAVGKLGMIRPVAIEYITVSQLKKEQR
jgi:cell division protein FtsL